MRKNIGIIDSGIGGLSLLEEIFNQKLEINCFYMCDHSNVPFGGKTQDFMLERMNIMVNSLKEKEISNILIACNTLTVETINHLRDKHLDINFIGIEPYINYINHIINADKRNIGLILTPATFKSVRLNNLRSKFDKEERLKVFPLEKLALIIEDGFFKGHINSNNLDEELNVLKDKDLDELILGCTHYPLISNRIESILDVKVIDPHKNVIQRFREVSKIKEGISFDYVSCSFNCGNTWARLETQDLLSKLALLRTIN